MSTLILLRCRRHRDCKPFAALQVAFDAEKRRCCRELRASGQELERGAWLSTAHPLKAGVFCEYCLGEGKLEPLDVDSRDLEEIGLGDEPLIFQAPAGLDAEAEARGLQDRFPDRITHVETQPAIAAAFAAEDACADLHSTVRESLTQRILPAGGKLYAFQAHAIEAALRGEDVLVTTPTASGKSLCYWTPVLHSLLEDPTATALYLSPLVALAEDQFEGVTRYAPGAEGWAARTAAYSIHGDVRSLSFGGQELVVGRYDGSTAEANRPAVRQKKPRILFTTPDMLHKAILGGADGPWAYLLSGLRYVVVDELHTYRGLLGAQFANLMRRLVRLANRKGRRIQFLCASATLAAPAATAQALLGRKPTLVDASCGGPARAARSLVVLDSTSGEEARAISTEGKNVLTHLMERRVRTLAFTQSIAEGNRIQRLVKAELQSRNLRQVSINTYARELPRPLKRQRVADLRNGRSHALVSTRALSMGVDIGNVSAVVLAGYPGSIAEFWQQAGRAGRAGEGLVVFIAGTCPVDQFFAKHPAMLSALEAEPTFCNPNNPHVVRAHMLAALREAPLAPSEVAAFGPAAEGLLASLLVEGLAEVREGGYALSEGGRKLDVPPFRNLGFSVRAIDDHDEEVAMLDLGRAHHAYHRYAVVQIAERFYEVGKQYLDHERQRGEIRLRRVEDPTYVTRPKLRNDVLVLDTNASKVVASAHVGFGPVKVSVSVEGYTREPLPGRVESARYQPLGVAAPKPLSYDTQALWLALDPAALASWPGRDQIPGLYSAAGALRQAIALTQMSDISDLGAVGVQAHPDLGGRPGIFIYDTAQGGIGLSEAAFRDLMPAIERAHTILAECPHCNAHADSLGCPQCVTAGHGQEDAINRHVALAVLGALLPGAPRPAAAADTEAA